MAKNNNNQQINASERDFVFKSKDLSNDELKKEVIDPSSTEAKEELFMQSIFQKNEGDSALKGQIKDTVRAEGGKPEPSSIEYSDKNAQQEGDIKVEDQGVSAGLWQGLTTKIKQVFSETKEDINGIRSNRFLNEERAEKTELVERENPSQEDTFSDKQVFSEENLHQSNRAQVDTSQTQNTAESINEAPIAKDDSTNGFSPEHATLTAEINFDDGTPNALRGSIATEHSGQVGNAAEFNSAKVEVSGLSLNGDAGAQTTVSMWIQADPAGGWEMLAASDRYDLVIQNGNIGFNTARGDLFGSDASELSDGQWHHVVGVFTNGDVSQNMVYIDGIAQEMSQIQGTPSNSSANINSSGGSLFFGSWGANNNYTFSGSMDEVKVFNGSLSPDEVNSLYDIEADNLKWDSGLLSTQEDSVLIIEAAELLANDTDPEGDTLTISKVSDGEHGTVSLDEDGNIQFIPDENYHGEATFSYTVNDGEGGEDRATVTLNVSSVNDLPSIDVVNTITVDEDGTQLFTYNTTDIDSDNVVLTGNADNGTVVVNDNGTVSFTPNDDYFGEDTIVLTATDSNGGTTTQEILVTVNPIEDAPDAVDDGIFDPQSATLTAEINFDEGVPNALRGSIATEHSGQVGNAAEFNSAKVEVSGLSLNGDAGAQTTVSMWIQADPAGGWEMLAASDRYDLVIQNGNIGFNTARGDLFGSDASELSDGQWHHVVGVFTNGDVSQNMVYIDGIAQEMSQIQGTPSNSSANINSSGGSLFFGSWGANNNYTFSGSMDEVKVFNGELSNEDVNALYIIEFSNNKWDRTTFETNEDISLIIDPSQLLANDIDVDGDAISITSVQDAQHGSVEINGNGEVVFTPAENYHGEATFSYSIDDGKGNTDSAIVTLNIESVNDSPVITVVGTTVIEDVSKVIATAADIDGNIESSTLSAEHGTVTLDNEGNITYTPDTDYNGADTVSLSVTDDEGATTTQTINLAVDARNDNPDAIDDLLIISSNKLPNRGEIVSVTGDAVTVMGAIVSEGDALSSVDHWIFTHNGGPLTIDTLTESGNNFNDIDEDGVKNHIDTMMRLYDSNGNQIAVNDDSNQGVEDGSTNDLYGHIQDSYIDLNDLPPGEYTLSIGSWHLSQAEVEADQNDNSDKGRSYHIEQDTGPYQIQFSGDVEFTHESIVTIDEDSTLTLKASYFLGNDTDTEGDTLSIASVQDAASGTVILNDDDTISFTPNENHQGEASFTYTVSDGQGGFDTATVALMIPGADVEASEVTVSDGSGNDTVFGGEGNDTYVFSPFDGNDTFHGGEGGGWTDTIQLTANPEDGDSPWTIMVDGNQVDYDIGSGVLELQPDTSGVVTMADGSELNFDGVETIQW